MADGRNSEDAAGNSGLLIACCGVFYLVIPNQTGPDYIERPEWLDVQNALIVEPGNSQMDG